MAYLSIISPTISDPAAAIAEARWRRTAASFASPCWQSASSPPTAPLLSPMAHASWYFNPPPPLPVACPGLPPGPCAQLHAQLTPVPACSLSKMLRGGGGCLPCKHWTNAPSVVTWFRCVPVKLDFLKQIARAKQARCANESCPAPLIPHCCPCMRFSGNKAKHAPPASVSLVPTSSPLSGFSLIFSLISPAIIHA